MGGSKRTVEFARKQKKPCIHIHDRMRKGPERLKAFLGDKEVKPLNVSGPRASKEPEVGQFVMAILVSIAMQTFGYHSASCFDPGAAQGRRRTHKNPRGILITPPAIKDKVFILPQCLENIL
jgi:Circularly permutated YpsA SLOG family